MSGERWGPGLEPIPESREAADELEPAADGDELLDRLVTAGCEVRTLVPECVGVSLSVARHGVTLTLMSSDRRVAVLDAIQYLDDGPCVAAVASEQVTTFTQPDGPEVEATSEDGWQLFARATAAAGVRSTLTLPVLTGGEVTGSVNLYAASPNAFDGLHEEVARIFSAWAPGAVSNADLSFSTLQLARDAPRLLREAIRIDVAVGIIVVSLGVDESTARRLLHESATRAGIDEVHVALALLEMYRGSSSTEEE